MIKKLKYVYYGKLQEIQRYGHFNFISKVQPFLMGLHLNKVAKLVKLYTGVKGLNQPFFDTKTVDITGLWVKVENFIFDGIVSTF